MNLMYPVREGCRGSESIFLKMILFIYCVMYVHDISCVYEVCIWHICYSTCMEVRISQGVWMQE